MSKKHFEMDKDWLVFHPSPSVPEFSLPPGAVDAHCHVFGPGDVFPYAPERKYTPGDASKEDLWALRDHLGFERNVIVQATCHGHDNRALCDALKSSDGRARGVASVATDIADEELQELHKAGVRGARFNFVRRLVDPRPDKDYLELAERLADIGWHIVVYFEAQDLEGRFDFFASLPTAIVIDHMGRPDVSKDPYGPEFDRFIELMHAKPDAWCKVTCPERLSVSGPPDYQDVATFARRVVEAFPERVLWGTDWPHPNMKSHMPDDGKLVDFVPSIAVSEAFQHQLLVKNPMRLYWPEEHPMSHGKPYDDIPGTIVFDSDVARRGYWLNQFCMTLMKRENRHRFRENERAYLDEWPMAEEQKQAVLDRDYNRILAQGGNVYFFAKLFSTDKQSFEQAAAGMTGVSREEYRNMMLGGGRSPDGNRYKKEWEDG